MVHNRPIRRDTDLKAIAKDINYEIDMMRAALELRRKGPDLVHRNLYLELFLLHLRNLRDFLYGFSSNPDDVSAEDFDQDWPKRRPALGPVITAEKDRINRALAHLSYSRLSYKSGWKAPEMLAEIESAFDAFAQSLPSERRKLFGLH